MKFIGVSQGRGRQYIEGERFCSHVTYIYHSILTVAIIMGLTLPLFVVLFNYMRDTLTPDIWYLPFPGVYFYDESKPLAFILTYILIIIQLIGIVRSYGAVDSLFVAMCIHVRAGYRDLHDMISGINYNRNNNVLYKEIGKNRSKNYTRTGEEWSLDWPEKDKKILHEQIKECTDFYQFLTECFYAVERVSSGIIFTQFAGIVLIMCTSLFQMTSVISNLNF